MKQRVNIITTGGTIEKTYDEIEGTLSNRGSQLKAMLKRLRLPYTEVKSYDVLCKDSLDMTDEDRENILNAVKKLVPEKCPIVILHGTDTMELTACYIYKNYQPLPVPIVMTGAMKPFGFDDSDALQNFTEALFAAKIVPTNLYISMHGQLHAMPGVHKNRQTGTFEKR